MKILPLLLLPLLITACGGDDEDPYNGLYEVVSHTLTEEDGCENPAPVDDTMMCSDCVVKKPFIKIKTQSIFGRSLHALVNCDSLDACDDDDDPDRIDLSGGLFDSAGDGDGLKGEISGASYAGLSCGYTYVLFEMISTDDGIKVTRTESRLKPDSPSSMLQGDECLDLTDNKPPAGELLCKKKEVITARIAE